MKIQERRLFIWRVRQEPSSSSSLQDQSQKVDQNGLYSYRWRRSLDLLPTVCHPFWLKRHDPDNGYTLWNPAVCSKSDAGFRSVGCWIYCVIDTLDWIIASRSVLKNEYYRRQTTVIQLSFFTWRRPSINHANESSANASYALSVWNNDSHPNS